MPKINATYVRKHGNRYTVTVLDVKEGNVKIKDADGVHFVSEKIFHQFFREERKHNEN
jgi:hypothetical protein